jgi:hypothetical protein
MTKRAQIYQTGPKKMQHEARLNFSLDLCP